MLVGGPALAVASVKLFRVVDLPDEGLPTRPINGSRGIFQCVSYRDGSISYATRCVLPSAEMLDHGISSFIAARVANSPWRQSLGSVGRAAARTDVTEPALVAYDVEPKQGKSFLSMLVNMRVGGNSIGACVQSRSRGGNGKEKRWTRILDLHI